MGFIKDGIGAALGAGQVQTGFNKMPIKAPFQGNNNNKSSRPAQRSESSFERNSPYSNGYDDRGSYGQAQYRDSYPPPPRTPRYGAKDQQYQPDYGYDNSRGPFSDFSGAYDAPPSYDSQDKYAGSFDRPRSRYDDPRMSPYGGSQQYGGPQQDPYYQNTRSQPRMSGRSNGGFRPIAIPQSDYGDGKPFVRGYSAELQRYGITEREFFPILDEINKGIIPNPENQIFQKAANIAGFFVPGAAAAGLIAGQFAVGIGSAYGHISMLGKVLSKANLDVFVPKGLEICIGRTHDVDAELGLQGQQHAALEYSDPEDRMAQYGDLIAPLTTVLPPLQGQGRQDPIALLGKGIGARDRQRTMKKANKEKDKGKKSRKGDAVEGGLKWLMVRKATPESTQKWQETLQQSEAALEEERRQGSTQSGR